MTKSDLQDRMVVEYRNGEKRLVVGNVLMGQHMHGDLRNYTKQLKIKDADSGLDIVRVYSPVSVLKCVNNPDTSEIVWERQEIKEVTMAEIEEKFGCKVKIVKE